ncbi:PQQ-dependent sugar dehydrogenase [Oligoflexus tunisiensis]|uniref:PQQ-dependent sugar dehydrogenase n=1 Tax=Oligoflexus tunisiensis TaxID=708132 RepID=UPI000A4DE523|nr:PQQ-dependent sugar dehydrogenase [Oligoflexus tunisiensis]
MKRKILQAFLLSSCVTGAAWAQGTSEELKEEARSIFLNSCAASCHNSFVSPKLTDATGEVDWNAVKLYSNRILARVQEGSMPPRTAPPTQQITAAQRNSLVQYVKSLTATPDSMGLPLSTLKLASGFNIEVFAKAEGARSLAVSSEGIVFVGTGGFSNVDPNGRVHAIVPTASGRKVIALAWNLNNPNGVALKGNDLYVAEVTRVLKFTDAVGWVKANVDKNLGKKSAPYSVVYSGLPNQANHGWKYLSVGPDGKLYLNIGAPCNICLPDRDAYANIVRMNDDGSDFEVVARGVRNTVGMAWHPETRELWFTDNGRDQLGDNMPPDELNRLVSEGQDFGYPFCHAKTISDPTYGKNKDCSSDAFTKPEMELGAHVASLGLTFYDGEMFPVAYKNSIFVAEHGSWNRSRKNGYRLSLVQFGENGVGSYQPFISGWLNDADQTNWGRPVDVKNYVDGSLLLSDDQTGAIYRVYYQGN